MRGKPGHLFLTMAYTVLARRYRSQRFDDVVGQNPVAQTLKNAIKIGRVAHAYLFTGTRGVGKTTMARILAKSLNCLDSDGPTVEPCCKCDSCVAVNTGEDIDVIEIDGASNTSVDNIRELRQNAIYRPARARYKIYIIDEVHMLSTSAFNALLKILEEPPEHVKFIFATTEPNKVLATIQSRCQKFDFVNITAGDIGKQLKMILKQEKIKFDDGIILPLARLANGSMRDALSLLEKLISIGAKRLTVDMLEEFLGQPNREKVYNLIRQIGDSNSAGTLTAVNELFDTGLSSVQFVIALIEVVRDLIVLKSAGPESDLLILNAQQRQEITELAEKFDIAALVYNITVLEKLQWTVKNSDTPQALLEATMLRMALSEQFLNVNELMSQLGNLPRGRVVKKNGTVSEKKAQQPIGADKQAGQSEFVPSVKPEIESIKNNWQQIIAHIGAHASNHTAAALSSATPGSFEDGVLTLSFAPTAAMAMQLCQANGKKERLQSMLTNIIGTPLKVEFELSGADGQSKKARSKGAKISRQRVNEIIDDPAVKSLVTELDAKITEVQEE